MVIQWLSSKSEVLKINTRKFIIRYSCLKHIYKDKIRVVDWIAFLLAEYTDCWDMPAQLKLTLGSMVRSGLFRTGRPCKKNRRRPNDVTAPLQDQSSA